MNLNKSFFASALLVWFLAGLPIGAQAQQANPKSSGQAVRVAMERVPEIPQIRVFKLLPEDKLKFPELTSPELRDFQEVFVLNGFENAVLAFGDDTLIILLRRNWTPADETMVLRVIADHFSGTPVLASVKLVAPERGFYELFPELDSGQLKFHGETEGQVAFRGTDQARSLSQYLNVERKSLVLTGRFFWSRGGVLNAEFTVGRVFTGTLGKLTARGGLTTDRQLMAAVTFVTSFRGHRVIVIEDLKFLSPGHLHPTLFEKVFFQVGGPVWLRWEDFLVFAPGQTKEAFSQLGFELRKQINPTSGSHAFMTIQWSFRERGWVSRVGIRF